MCFQLASGTGCQSELNPQTLWETFFTNKASWPPSALLSLPLLQKFEYINYLGVDYIRDMYNFVGLNAKVENAIGFDDPSFIDVVKHEQNLFLHSICRPTTIHVKSLMIQWENHHKWVAMNRFCVVQHELQKNSYKCDAGICTHGIKIEQYNLSLSKYSLEL